MANYYTNFKPRPGPSRMKAAQAYALNLAQQAAGMQFAEDSPELPADFPASLVDVPEIWNFETEAENSPDQINTDSGCIPTTAESMRSANSSSICSGSSIPKVA